MINSYLTNKSSGKLPELNLLLLSAHDSTLAPILSIFYPNNVDCVMEEYNKIYNEKKKIDESACILHEMAYTANFIIELQKTEGEKYSIELFLNNKPFNSFEDKTNKTSLESF